MSSKFYYNPKTKLESSYIQERKNAVALKYSLLKKESNNWFQREIYFRILEKVELLQISTSRNLYHNKFINQ